MVFVQTTKPIPSAPSAIFYLFWDKTRDCRKRKTFFAQM